MMSWHRNDKLFGIQLPTAKWTAHRNKATDFGGIIHWCWKTVIIFLHNTQFLWLCWIAWICNMVTNINPSTQKHSQLTWSKSDSDGGVLSFNSIARFATAVSVNNIDNFHPNRTTVCPRCTALQLCQCTCEATQNEETKKCGTHVLAWSTLHYLRCLEKSYYFFRYAWHAPGA